MTAVDPTPAVERARDVIGEQADTEFPRAVAQAALGAALTDPDDPDWLARTLFDTFRSVKGGRTEWDDLPEWSKPFWRDLADGLRATITGDAEWDIRKDPWGTSDEKFSEE